ncbi:MAG: O-antigen ligase family protein [Pseudomonas sp.]|uniref:O-antigen ligase family protein n=1 Tax=Pseudomonas abieticivorans TaxID=2931382 RepID=UPI0020C06C48|nr:O-antigen ligase family protein [Pseudomonas sp. PIA16]MDE1167653.1 O-antigen ligase family protein [Pseudomonas sp.]
MPLAFPLALIFSLVFGVMAWLLPAFKVAAALVGIAAIVTVIRKPLWGLLLFAVIATFLPYTTVEVGIRTTVSEALIMLVWASLMAQALFGQTGPRSQRLPTERLLIAFMLFSVFPFIIGLIVIKADGNGPVNWVRWLFNLSTLFLVPRLLDTRQAREQMIIGILLGTLAMLLLSIPVYLKNGTASSITPILESLGYSSTEAVEKGLASFNSRMGSTWMHPNVTGGALAMLLPLAACFGLTRKGWPRALGLAVTLLGGLGLLMTGSRGALLSLAVVLLWMASRKVPYTGRVLMTALVLGALTLVLYPPLQERVLALFSSNDASTSVRFDEYANFPEAMARYPFGIGFKVDPPVPDSGLYGISNLWLNYVYKLGVLGMLFFCAVIWSWWKHSRPQTKSLILTHDNAIWLGCTSGVMAALVSGLFDHYFSFTTVLIALFWLFLGLSLREAKRLAAAPAQPQTPAGSQP